MHQVYSPYKRRNYGDRDSEGETRGYKKKKIALEIVEMEARVNERIHGEREEMRAEMKTMFDVHLKAIFDAYAQSQGGKKL